MSTPVHDSIIRLLHFHVRKTVGCGHGTHWYSASVCGT